MLGSIKKRGKALRTNLYGDVFWTVIKFDFAGTTNDPDGIDPSESVTFAHVDTGDYSITFDEEVKPKNVITAIVNIEGDEPTLTAKWTGYTASTGVLTFTVHEEDGTSGISAAANVADGVEATILILCGANALTDPA